MTSLNNTIEELIAEKIETLSYEPVRCTEGGYYVSFSPPPSAIIYPAEIASIEGEGRGRITLDCEVVAMQSCINQSPEAISELYAQMRRDFTKLPSLLISGENIVSVSSFTITSVESKERPRTMVASKIKFEITVDYIEGGSGENRL